MLYANKIYILDKKKFIKNGSATDYWYKIWFLFLNEKYNVLQYGECAIKEDVFNEVEVNLPPSALAAFDGYIFDGHYENYKFKPDLFLKKESGTNDLH